MKSIGKALGKEIARILVILAVIAAVVFYLKGNNWFKKSLKVIQRINTNLLLNVFQRDMNYLWLRQQQRLRKLKDLIQMQQKIGQIGQRQLLI